MRNRLTTALLPTALALAPAIALAGDLRLGSIAFGDHMVLQRQVPVPVWGRARPGARVSVDLAGRSASATASSDGTWRVDLPPLAAGGPHQMTVASAGETILVRGVLVGEVWLCSGQSNMARGVAPADARRAHPRVRALRKRGWEDVPSETAFWIGAALDDALGVPVGILNEAVSGSSIGPWLGPDAEADLPPEVQATLGPATGSLFDRRIAPLLPYAIRGVFWWQGENESRGVAFAGPYHDLLVALIRSWRRAMAAPDLPFLFVEVPTGRGVRADGRVAPLPARVPRPRAATLMYDAFQRTLLEEPATGMAANKDLRGSLHPRRRDLYAERLVRWALHSVYGRDLVYAGPIFESLSRDVDGSLRVHFRPGTAAGLQALGDRPLQGFQISPDGRHFEWAVARIERDADGPGRDAVVLSHPSMSRPVAVNYAWDYNPRWANLFNGARFGAAPFQASLGSASGG